MNQNDSVSLQKCFVVDSPEMLRGGEGQRWRGGGSWELVFNSSASFIHLCHFGTHQTALWQHLTLHFLFVGNSFKRRNDLHT